MKQKIKYNFVRKHCNKNSENETKSKAFHLLCLHIVYSFSVCCRRNLTSFSFLLLSEDQDLLSTWKINLDTLLPFDYCFVCILQNVSHPDWTTNNTE